ncbi:MAG: hypothetical protein ACHREM_14930 [Polyangiales bacterium]
MNRLASIVLFSMFLGCGGKVATSAVVAADPVASTPRLSRFCGDGATADTALALVNNDGVRLLSGDGVLTKVAALATANPQFTLTARFLAIEVRDATTSYSVFDRTGAQLWTRALAGDVLGMRGTLSDGSLVVQTYVDGQAQTHRINDVLDALVVTGPSVSLVDGDWILFRYEDTPPGKVPVVSHYEWRRPTTGDVVAVERGWTYLWAGTRFLFNDADSSVVGLILPGEGALHTKLSLQAPIDALLDGGSDLVFTVTGPNDTASRQAWRVARDLSSATPMSLPSAQIGWPTLDASGAIFALTAPGDASLMQPTWSNDGAKSFVPIGAAIATEFGGGVDVRGTTAAISIEEGHTFVEPVVLQIFYDHASTPQVMRYADRPFESFALSPDGECAAYSEYDKDSGNWQLVVRTLRTQQELRPGTPVAGWSAANLGLAWWP